MPSIKNVTLNFPLSVILIDKEITDKLKNVFSYSIVEYALQNKDKLIDDWECNDGDYNVYHHLANCDIEDRMPKGFDLENTNHRAVCYANLNEAMPVTSMDELFLRHSEIGKFIAEYEKQFGKDAYVQISRAIFMQALRRTLDFYTFSFICAVASKIGKKSTYKRITLEQILSRMNGLKSPSLFKLLQTESVFIAGKDVSKNIYFLHDSKLKRIKDSASQKGGNFFRTYTYRNRLTYYSTRLTEEELIKAAFTRANRIIESNIHKMQLEDELIAEQKEKYELRKQLLAQRKSSSSESIIVNIKKVI